MYSGLANIFLTFSMKSMTFFLFLYIFTSKTKCYSVKEEKNILRKIIVDFQNKLTVKRTNMFWNAYCFCRIGVLFSSWLHHRGVASILEKERWNLNSCPVLSFVKWGGDETQGYFRCPLTQTCNDLWTLVLDKLHMKPKCDINRFSKGLINSGFAWSLGIAGISLKMSFNHTVHGRMYFAVGDLYDMPWYLSHSYVLFLILGKRNRGGKFFR